MTEAGYGAACPSPITPPAWGAEPFGAPMSHTESRHLTDRQFIFFHYWLDWWLFLRLIDCLVYTILENRKKTSFLEPKVASSCPTNSPKPKDIQFSLIKSSDVSHLRSWIPRMLNHFNFYWLLDCCKQSAFKQRVERILKIVCFWSVYECLRSATVSIIHMLIAYVRCIFSLWGIMFYVHIYTVYTDQSAVTQTVVS